MKIIKEGILPPPTPFFGTCDLCKCQVECDSYESYTQNDYTDEQFPEVNHYIKCPTTGCKQSIKLYPGSSSPPFKHEWSLQ